MMIKQKIALSKSLRLIVTLSPVTIIVSLMQLPTAKMKMQDMLGIGV